MTRRLVPGLYERMVTARLAEELGSLSGELGVERLELDPEESHLVLARHLHPILASALRVIPKDASEKVAAQVALCNRILDVLRETAVESGIDEKDAIAAAAEELRAIYAKVAMAGSPPTRPGIPLSASALLVNARDEHRIGHELRRELASADAVDLLCSFVKWSGLRVLEDALGAFLRAGKPLRVLTTAYLGATEGRAIDELVRMGAKLRVSFDTRRTRLHAKAWLFHRETGFSTAYIGSSNLSSSALLDGLEWNVRTSCIDASDIVEKFRATFESYWEDPEFEPYEPERDRKRFDQAVRAERGKDDELNLALLDVHPYPHQQEILDRLDAERRLHGRTRNLVVAATGTGKTIIAALDYRRCRSEWGERLLFVAHRKEILDQSRRKFAAVLKDGSFGERWVEGDRPTELRHVFASIQTLANVDLAALPPDAFDIVIVDEFHHAAAPSYERLLQHLKPRILLGLTATPERADGESVVTWFDDHVAADLRLWDALERGLLCPFQYFGIHDGIDLSRLAWKRGRYETNELERIYTGNDARVALVAQALQDKVRDVRRMRALGFCVGVSHAEFMAAKFTNAGIPSIAVSGNSSREDRDSALRKLRDREINVLFAVDLFNEGVDVPEIDTVLFLRPTESATVFLQQLGRGLRLSQEKECLTVLDFIGQAHRRFRFDLRFRAILGGTRASAEAQIEEAFPVLPAGCSIQLDRESTRVVLENVRQAVGRGIRGLAGELQEMRRDLGRVPTLREFLDTARLDPIELYRGHGECWTEVLRAAGIETPPVGPDEERLARALGGLLHVDDPERIALWSEALDADAALGEGERRRRLLLMLHACFWRTKENAPTSIMESLARIRSHPAIVTEIKELLAILEDRVDHLTHAIDPTGALPLRVHARYSLDEVLAAFGITTPERPYRIREGVHFDKASATDLLFVTIQKSESEYSPRTMYRDYAISPQLFHWESQSTTSEASPTGQRYFHHAERGTNVMLFVRKSRKDSRGLAEPYVFLGLADYMQHVGERPLAITWRLRREMPAAIFRGARIAAA